MLGIQLFVTRGEAYSPTRMDKIKNRDVKPYGGLWTSTFDVETKSAWIDFCTKEEFNLPASGVWRGYLLKPMRKARIYVIDSFDDLKQLIDKYSYNPYKDLQFSIWSTLRDKRYIDFEALSKDYDAIHLTQEGQWLTRHTEPFNLYGWDFESTLWLRDCFTNVIPISITADMARQEIREIEGKFEEMREKMRNGEFLRELQEQEIELIETYAKEGVTYEKMA